MLGLLADLNQLGPVDIGFFVACAAIIAIIVAIYFLIPVFNKKQYKEQRDNLKKREVAFKSNLKVEETEETSETVAQNDTNKPTDE